MATLNTLLIPGIEQVPFSLDCSPWYRGIVTECTPNGERITWTASPAKWSKDPQEARLTADVHVDYLSYQRRHQLQLAL